MTFSQARRQMMESGVPSHGDNLLGMDYDFFVFVGRCPGLTDVSVERTANTEALIELSCVAEPSSRPEEVARQLVKIWLRDLRYSYREAHQVTVSPDRVVVELVTQIDERGFYVTATIAVRWPLARGSAPKPLARTFP